MKILGKRPDGVVIADIGTKTAYAVDLTSRRYAYMGDVDSTLVARTPLEEIAPQDVTDLRLRARRVLEYGKKVDLAFIPFQKKTDAPAMDKKACDDTTPLADDEVCSDGYIEKKKAATGNPFAKA